MAEVTEAAVESALNEAFVDAPRVAKESERPAEPDEEPPVAEEAEPEAVSADPPEEEAAPVETEPEFEIEVDGQVEVVKGKDQIKELLQKGRDYSKKSEVVARARDALQAQFQQHQHAVKFQEAVFGDVTELRAIDSQLNQFNQVDWGAEFDRDPFGAMKLKEQRDQLREQRTAKLGELNQKQQQFQQSQAEAARQMLAAESAALTAKLPEWRNSETRAKEQQQIRDTLQNVFGFNEAEVNGVQDHRMLLVARAAAKWFELQKGKTDKVGLVRAAPPVVKPGAPQDKGKAETRNDMKALRAAVKNNDSRAQEEIAAKLFARAWK